MLWRAGNGERNAEVLCPMWTWLGGEGDMGSFEIGIYGRLLKGEGRM